MGHVTGWRSTTTISSGHLLTCFRTAQAGGSTLFHAVELAATQSARPADLGALAADVAMMVRATRHEVDRRRANLNAIQHDPNVVGGNVRTADLNAVVHEH